MQAKRINRHHEQGNGHKAAAGHGHFKHLAAPATLQTMLQAYGLSRSAYDRVKLLVAHESSKKALAAR